MTTSSEDSVSTGTGSRIRQFGLYRSIDARTEEFLRLSRKRQIKQGCACAAISTAITVTIVIVILLIYEYAIAVESSLVQNKRRANRRHDIVNTTNDTPFADRLDRSYFGFDQDYYERMPLLVNALQENSYVDPTVDAGNENKENNYLSPPKSNLKIVNSYKPNLVRRTSPRPFYFEYKSPTPVPFSKTYRSKSWIESYRNAQRLKNIQQVIKYLEKTINAKIGDMYTAPPSKHIAFTGVYMEPGVLQDTSQESSEHDLFGDSSNKPGVFKSNHEADPLFRFKPDSPGEVNLLADSYLRFSPTPGSGKKDLPNIPMFRPIPNYKRNCFGSSCDEKKVNDILSSSSDTHFDKTLSFNKAKSFSVMLNMFPFKSNLNQGLKNVDTPKTPVENIYLTTSKPLILFKRKSTNNGRRKTIAKRPRIIEHRSTLQDIEGNLNSREKINDSNSRSNMIVQINLYTPEKKTGTTTDIQNITDPFMPSTPNNVVSFAPDHTTEAPYYSSTRTTEIPLLLSTTQVEDFHIGSSGIIPIENRVAPITLPPPTSPTPVPFFDVTLSSTEGTWVTKPPDMLKFSHEDAKIPDEYRRYRELDISENNYSDNNRRNSRGSFELEDFESRTLVTKLRNEFENFATTTEYSKVEDRDSTTTTQINGHYRSVNHNSKFLNTLLDPNSEMNRKRRLNLFAKGFRRANFLLNYVEIKRNSTTTDSPLDN